MITLRHLIPMLVVVVVAVLGPLLSEPDRCSSTDAQQFKCWLEDQ